LLRWDLIKKKNITLLERANPRVQDLQRRLTKAWGVRWWGQDFDVERGFGCG